MLAGSSRRNDRTPACWAPVVPGRQFADRRGAIAGLLQQRARRDGPREDRPLALERQVAPDMLLGGICIRRCCRCRRDPCDSPSAARSAGRTPGTPEYASVNPDPLGPRSGRCSGMPDLLLAITAELAPMSRGRMKMMFGQHFARDVGARQVADGRGRRSRSGCLFTKSRRLIVPHPKRKESPPRIYSAAWRTRHPARLSAFRRGWPARGWPSRGGCAVTRAIRRPTPQCGRDLHGRHGICGSRHFTEARPAPRPHRSPLAGGHAGSPTASRRPSAARVPGSPVDRLLLNRASVSRRWGRTRRRASPTDEDTIADAQARGYACGIFGKWHGRPPAMPALQQGFDECRPAVTE